MLQLKYQIEEEDRFLRNLYQIPLLKEFEGKAGITQKYYKYDYYQGRREKWGPRLIWDLNLELARGLEKRGLVSISFLGSCAFEVSTVFDENQLTN
jgi:hypothetical protein